MAIKKCFSVVGFHNVGKTTLISEMIPILKEKGLTVSTIKHAKHMGLKDSDILFQSGSEDTIVVSDDFSLRYFRTTDLPSLIGMVNSDILIIEGFKEGGFPKIIRAKVLNEAEELIDELTIALVLDKPERREVNGIPVFSPGEIENIVDVALNRSFPPLPMLDCGKCGLKKCYEMAKAILNGDRKYSDCPVLPLRVILKVNGIQVPLKPFVEDIFVAINMALVNTLKGRPEAPKEIELQIRL